MQGPKLLPKGLNFPRSPEVKGTVSLMEGQQAFVGVRANCGGLCLRLRLGGLTGSWVDDGLPTTEVEHNTAIDLTNRLMAIAGQILLKA
jgi:hypothetical protein